MGLFEHGIYFVKDQYFKDFPSKHWMLNKGEKRPHYYAIKDTAGVMWLIPMSSRVENYKRKINSEEKKRGKGNCIFYHIGLFAGKESVFIISDMMPITDTYIARSYLINNVEYVIKNDNLNRRLRSKTVRYIRLLEQRKLTDRNHVLKIREKLAK